MNIDFNNIFQHEVPMEIFRLKWRFLEKKFDTLPNHHLEQLKPLDKEASKYLHNYISNLNLHNDFPFKKDFFQTIESIRILDDNEMKIKKWLYHRGLPFDKPVFLSWNEEDAMIVPWKLLIKYFDSFYYGGSDDLTIIDSSLNWSLLFFHEDEIYFGTNKNFRPSVCIQ